MPPKELYGSQMTIRARNFDGTYGVPIEFIGPFLIEEEPVETETSNKMILQYINNTTTTFSGTLILPHKKMSRKTFKKWLMQYSWIDRNSAEGWCCLIADANGRVSYGRIYQDMILGPTYFGLISSVTRQLKETKK